MRDFLAFVLAIAIIIFLTSHDGEMAELFMQWLRSAAV